MRGYSALLFLFLLFFVGCEKKDFSQTPAKMHWDRDMCERCKMAISERKYAVEGVDAKNRVYKFDDIGCLVLWQKLEHPEVHFKKIWIKDAKSGKWIDAKKACYTQDAVTPMGYGFAAHEKPPKNSECIGYEKMKKTIEKIGR